MNTLTKEQWIEEVYRLLFISQAPANETECANLRSYAEGIYDWEMECADGVHADIQSPRDAHDEELSCG